MFERGDEQYLLRAMNRNIVTLFVGAGFSTLAKNSFGKTLPQGNRLAEQIWGFLGYADSYDPSQTTLSELYEALLTSGKSKASIQEFLGSHLLCCDLPDEYRLITKVFWSRIYTTNIDNVLELIYANCTEPRLDIRSFPRDELSDRDVLLDRLQAVHLHGRIPCDPNDVTFSTTQFARRAPSHDHLYDHFVRDYSTKPTLFVGTALNEPLLWQYIEIRKARHASTPEERPKSFLISPSVSAPKKQLLSAMNVVHVEGTISEFLNWIASKSKDIAGKDDVLRVTIPGLVELLRGVERGTERDLHAVREFGRLFHAIPTDSAAVSKSRSLFLLGASPKWEDLLSSKDASREINAKIQSEIEGRLQESAEVLSLVSIIGSAGSGKSTVMRRVAIQLAQAGHTCFLTNSEELSRFDEIARALNHIGRRSVLFFDNAETILPALPRLMEVLQLIDHPPVMVVASRRNDFERLHPKLPKTASMVEFEIPHLSRSEIRAVLAVLERENLLGVLKGMSIDARIQEFEVKANKQLLVAMREATSGRGFDEIIEDEFASLVPDESKSLYLCVALATEAGYRLTLQEFVGCSKLPPADTLSILSKNLSDIVLRTGVADDLLMLRHRRIAEHLVNRASPRELLLDAYLRLLGVLSSEIGDTPKRSRTFSLFKTLINHHIVYRRFEESITQARELFDSLQSKYSGNAQFLLQYGSLEMEAGNLDIAENYLNQASSLDPANPFIANARGQLLLKQAIKASNKASAVELRDEGSKILMQNILDPELDDAYCYHIYCQLRLHWVRKWGGDYKEKKSELEELKDISSKAFLKYPKDRRIGDVKLEIERDYYSLAIKD